MASSPTRRVWIEVAGDPAFPLNIKVFDEASGVPLTTLQAITVAWVAGAYTHAELVYGNGQKELGIIVPRPALNSAPDGGPKFSIDLRAKPTPAPVKVCPECNGTGEYESPVTGKKSPCKSCAPKPTGGTVKANGRGKIGKWGKRSGAFSASNRSALKS